MDDEFVLNYHKKKYGMTTFVSKPSLIVIRKITELIIKDPKSSLPYIFINSERCV